MNAFEIPNLRFSLPAGGAVERHRLITVDSNSNGIQAVAATTTFIGASMNKAAAGEVLEVADGIVMVEAGAAITAGSVVKADANGKAITGETSNAIAITTGVVGGLLAVKIG